MRLTILLCIAATFVTQCAAAKPEKKTPKLDIQVTDWKGVQKLVQQNKKKVVVLNIWTTTCGMCIEEFPKFVELQKSIGSKKLTCIAVNCDYDGIEAKPPKYYEPDVRKFLTKQRANFTHVMLNRAFIDFLEDVDLATTPAFYVYSAGGKLAKRFDNDDVEKIEDEFKFEDVQNLVTQLAAKVVSKAKK